MGIVKIKNGVKLGSILYGIDSRWRAPVDMYSLKFRFAKTKDDAMNWLVNKCTETMQISVDGGPRQTIRVMSIQPSLEIDFVDGRTIYSMTFIYDSHGLSVGQRIDVRSSRYSALVHDGIISEVNGGEIEWG